MPAVNGRFLQIAGFKYSWSQGAASGSRVQSVDAGGRPGATIKDIPKTDTTEYKMVTNDFTNAGGDGYACWCSPTRRRSAR